MAYRPKKSWPRCGIRPVKCPIWWERSKRKIKQYEQKWFDLQWEKIRDAFGFVRIQMPDPGQPVTRRSFRFHVDKAKLQAAHLRDGHYLLRSNLTAVPPPRPLDSLTCN